MGVVRAFGQILLFLSVLALGLVSTSAPIIPKLCFIRGQFANGITLLLGLSGGCVIVGDSQTCPASKIGYSITLDNFPNKTSSGELPLNPTLTYALVLFPIAGLIGLLALFLSLPSRSRISHYLSVSCILLTFLTSVPALACALYLFIRAIQRIDDQFAPASPASLGPAMWIAIGAVVGVAFSGMLIAGSGSNAPSKASASIAASSQRSLTNDRYTAEPAYYHTSEALKYSGRSGSVYGAPSPRGLISEPHLIQQGMDITPQEKNPNQGYYFPAEDEQQQYNYYEGEQEMRDRRKMSRSASRASRTSRSSSRYH